MYLVQSTEYHLWEDGELAPEDHERIFESVQEIVCPLAGAVEWARQTDASADSWLRNLINETVDTLRQVATNLVSLGYPKTARYL